MHEDAFGLQGKAALVVGGGQGIGEAAVLALAGAGCDVAVLDAVAERAQAVAARARGLGCNALPLVGDVLDDAQSGAIVADAERTFGRLDVLVTIVGLAGYRPIIETSAEQWDLEQKLNLRYAFLVGKAFAAARIRAGAPGVATFVSSVSGIVSAPSHGAYGAAKAGLIHLVKTMAVEWAPHGIRVNSVAPGPIVTPRLPDTEQWRTQIRRSAHPMQRRGLPEEIGNAILFLSSDLASYVTGQTLAVDGGLTAANILAVPADPGGERPNG